ncbi:ABC-F family ATP-binding cassette domain-containing protein [Candidatus Dependentiae bacterium]|nr:ABC-F family ATP-binding cassette domain-containing protein [Candidatus Dependentiae bacterium]
MIYVKNGSLSFGSQNLFDSINLAFQQDQKIGVFGRNGTGKSTLLKIISGMARFDEGSVDIERYKRIGYMPQEVTLLSEKSVYDETLSVFERFIELEREKAAIEAELEKSTHDTINPDTLERYSALLEECCTHDLALAKERTERILKGLGFSRKMFDQPVQELSVGWKMRVVLAKLLLEDADFYLFDEPTNHLDLPTKEWFLEFLKQGRFGFLLVSHDRHYLDDGCDYILGLERGRAKVFRGNFSAYLKEEEHQRELTQSAYVRQQKEITRKQETIERFRASASKARMAQSMEKQLDKMERVEVDPIMPSLKLTFPPTERPGACVLTVENVRHAFEGNTLFEKVSSIVQRGDKVALVAPNGTGKTTLFNVLTGKYSLQGGKVILGHNVTYAVFEQDQLKSLNPRNTIIEELFQSVPQVQESVIRSFLGSFLFSGDSIQKKISVLSGGERNRVAMVKVLLQKANFLLLDEPTNHLDLYAKEVLLQALQRYEGTMLFVSHDHSFLQSLANRVWELTPEGLHDFKGSYEEYLYYKKSKETPEEDSKAQGASSKQPAPKAADKNAGDPLKKELNSLEQRIAKTEQDIESLNKSFLTIAYGSTEYEKAAQRLKRSQKNLEELTAQWESLSVG